jgi:large subunit ribosomal protein L4
MANIAVINSALEAQREIALPEEIFGVPYRQDLVYEAVRSYAANQRLGTHSTKRRDEVSGAGKKLWKQKHTGRARMGEVRSPLWYHGGIVFGPKPRDYSYAIPKKVRRSAMRSLLAERLRRGLLKVIDALALEGAKTKGFVAKFGPLFEAHKTVLFVDERVAPEVLRASRNVPGVKVTGLDEINVYDLARYEMVVFTEPALMKLAEVLKP